MKFQEDGTVTFFDEKDRVSYGTLLSSIKNSSDRFIMTISVYQKEGISQKQKKLFKVLINLIASESGNDVDTIEETLLNSFRKGIRSLEDFNHKDFSDFLEWSVLFCQEFFDVNIQINDNYNFEVKKIK